MKHYALIGAGLLVVVLVITSWVLTRSEFDGSLAGDATSGLTLYPVEEALTFARVRSGEGEQVVTRLVIVREIVPEGLRVVDVGRSISRPMDDPVVALTMNGYEEMDYVARRGVAELVALADLTVPLATGDAHIAAGTNFKAHAEEVNVEGGPFLFPKLAAPTSWNAKVARRGRFDYEAELCAVPLTSVLPDRMAEFGYVLCNDFTDRWPLVRDVDFDKPMGTTGFPEAKGGEGMLPLGPFFVVPRVGRDFWKSIELELYVDGKLRQKSSAGLMIWSPEEIATNALTGCDVDYLRGEDRLKLVGCGRIPAGTILLTGTPEGVLFHPATIWNPLAYLRSGDEVVLRARNLGVLVNRVE